MNLGRLAIRNIAGSSFRSVVVLSCALVVTGFFLATTLIIRGVENSLKLGIQRLGADILVVPQGAEAPAESALLMGIPVSAWMPADNVDKITRVSGVAAASPQLYLTTISAASYCTVSEMSLVAYDPQTDFTIEPWLKDKIGRGLRRGEAVGGQYVFTPEGEDIKVYGYVVTLAANLEPTGTGIDQTMFLTFETAREIARLSSGDVDGTISLVIPDSATGVDQTVLRSSDIVREGARFSPPPAGEALVIPDNSISAVMVRVQPGSDPKAVAAQIIREVPAVTPILSPDLFQTFRSQMTGLLRGVLATLVITWGLSVALIGLVFSMAANERRREIGMLRALGATRLFVFRSLLAEAGILALGGGVAGIILATIGVVLFGRLIMLPLNTPFLLPAVGEILALIGGGLALALATVTLAALIPALRISHQDPAFAMRE